MAQNYDPFADPHLADGLWGGVIPTPADEYAAVWAFPRARLVPAGVLVNHDLRAYKGQSLFPPIGDQGQIGSCAAWCFGYYLRAALASKWHVDNGTTPDLPDTLSPRFVYDLTRARMGTYPEDSGSDMKTAASVLADLGCAPERDLPYTGRADNGPIDREITDHVKEAGAFYGVSGYYRCAGTGQTLVESIIAALDMGYPVALAFLVEQSFMNTGSDGRVPTPNGSGQILGGHAVCCVGNYYDNSFAGGGALAFVNSWGTGFGQSGVGFMPFSYATTQTRYGPMLMEAWVCA
jgi:C1A family cysteine protease